MGAQWSVDTLWRRSQVSIVDGHPSWLTAASQRPHPKSRSPENPNPREECTSVFLRILWKRQRVVAPRSPLKKKDSFSCRHCFPVLSRAAPEWLYHFRSSGRHFDSYAHIMDYAGVLAVIQLQFSRKVGLEEEGFLQNCKTGTPADLHQARHFLQAWPQAGISPHFESLHNGRTCCEPHVHVCTPWRSLRGSPCSRRCTCCGRRGHTLACGKLHAPLAHCTLPCVW